VVTHPGTNSHNFSLTSSKVHTTTFEVETEKKVDFNYESKVPSREFILCSPEERLD
jgi:hypothetical protein